MEFLQLTLEEIIESERLMLLAAEDRYGKSLNRHLAVMLAEERLRDDGNGA